MKIFASNLLVAALACSAASSGVVGISPEDLLSNPPKDVLILDVRSEDEFNAGHVPNAVNIPHDELASRLPEFEGETRRPVVVYCEGGRRAGMAASVLLDAGYADVRHLDGDMSDWRAKGRPTTTPKTLDVEKLRSQSKAIFGRLPEVAASPTNSVTNEKVDLGRMLYYDTRLSKNQDVSCNSCHLLGSFGDDGQATSPGHRGQRGSRNSPTVYNAALHIAQFWDGRAADVEEQAKGPVLNPIEMAMPSPEAVIAVLLSMPGYVEAFSSSFPNESDPVTYDNMAKAIGAFERKLVTPGRFDAFMDGDDEAMTAAELEGLERFIGTGCVACHMGPAVGGGMYQKLGLVKLYETADPGRFGVTGNEADRRVFKVPSLRNIAETGPYLHDGSIGSLEEAVALMAEYQLGKQLTNEENKSIRTFLGALKGEVNAAFVAKPSLPESGPDTPKPDPS